MATSLGITLIQGGSSIVLNLRALPPPPPVFWGQMNNEKWAYFLAG